MYGLVAVAERTARIWFARLKAGDFDLEAQELRGTPSTQDQYLIKTVIENNSLSTIRQSAEMCNKSKSTIYNYIVKLGYINRLDVRVLHDITEKNLNYHLRLAL